MAGDNVEVVRAVIDGWLRSDPAAMELIAEDVVYVNPASILETRTYEGHAGVLQWVVDWRREWDGYELEVLHAEDLDGEHVLTLELNRATGRRSGVEVEMRTVSLFRVRSGKVVHWQGFATEEEARAAAAARV